MKAIDKVEELIGHSPHPAIVAIPIGAWLTSTIADGFAIATKKTAYDDAARISMAVGLVGAVGAIVTGLHDYGYIPKAREPSQSIATRHGWGNAVATSLFLISFVLRVRASQAKQSPSIFSRMLALAGSGTVAYTGWLGGKLVEEQGEGVKPIIQQQNEVENVRKRILSEDHSGPVHMQTEKSG
ncbi:MAG: DUF2231 domain-containing protein [Methylotenera sp.]|nr:DUF2231 domain-containing protein [Oligoflexia bacterium]